MAQIPAARQRLEAQRLAAAVNFDLSAAARIPGEIHARDLEKAAGREDSALRSREVR